MTNCIQLKQNLPEGSIKVVVNTDVAASDVCQNADWTSNLENFSSPKLSKCVLNTLMYMLLSTDIIIDLCKVYTYLNVDIPFLYSMLALPFLVPVVLVLAWVCTISGYLSYFPPSCLWLL